MTRYNLGFSDPYYTLDGVSLGYNLGYATRNAYAANLASYNTNIANGSMNFGIPLNEFNRLGFDLELKHTGISSTTLSSTQITNYIKTNGSSFNTFSLSGGWTHDTLDRPTFSHKGGQQRFSALATVPGSDLDYFKVSYKHQHFFPIANDFTFRLLGEISHGDTYGKTKEYPFFENYYAGGTGDVRGFMQNTMGPRDSYNRPFGGSTKAIAKAELFFPVPLLSELKSVRVGAFLDGGSLANQFSISGSQGLDHFFRYSAGLSGEWLSPFGALAVSIAHPMNSQPNDLTQAFQFTFGSGF